MNLRLFIFVVICWGSLLAASGQKNQTGNYWIENPEPIPLEAQFENENVVGVFSLDKFEYFYAPSGSLHYNHITHRRLRLNSNDAVNSFNTMSVSLSNVVKVRDLKARVIKPDGRIIEFDQNNIREVDDETRNQNLKIFAIDGIETGDDIEYFIMREMTGGNFGRVFLQHKYPLQSATFELISPENLIYVSKAYNLGSEVETAQTKDGRNRISLKVDNISALKDEPYSFLQPRRARIEYRLDFNHARGRGKVLTWNDAAQRIYEIMYNDIDERELNRWIRSLGRLPVTPFEKVLEIEEYLKSNITVQDYNLPEFSDLAYVRSNKVTGKQGIVRLYANLFKALGINHTVVVTADRTEVPFDHEFESWNYLDHFLIYLPDDDLYLDPDADFMRVGCIDGVYTATYGLFVKTISIGTFESAVAELKYINPAPHQTNYDNLKIYMALDVENLSTSIKLTRAFSGLSGGYLGRIYNSIDRDRQLELLKDIMESKAPNPVYDFLDVEEKSDDSFFEGADFLIKSHFETQAFTQRAGNRILFSIGESIGPQAELYFDDQRDFGATTTFNRSYKRVITFEVPVGYRILNPEVANMNVVDDEGDESLFGFISNHSLQDNVYTIEIDEYYKVVNVEPGRFEGFRNVINAAADFNKVTLILEKI